MTKKWVMGLAGAIALIAVAGTGFAAFTATATVNGSASAASVGLAIVENATYGCYGYYNIPGAPGDIAFTGENAQETEISLSVSNLTPSTYCVATILLQNTGSLPENVSVNLNTAGSDGICVIGGSNCYDVFTYSGISAQGSIWWVGGVNYGIAGDSSPGFVVLSPGGTYYDIIGVAITPYSDDSTPSSASFSLVYSTSEGI